MSYLSFGINFLKVITDEERKAFMNNVPDMVKSGDLASQTNNNIDEEEQEKFFVEKVIKMRVSKKGKEEFLVKWAGYPLRQLGNHFKTFPGKKHVRVQRIPFNQSCIVNVSANKSCLLKRSRSLGIEKERLWGDHI
jgi:hypothetical protein